MEKTEMSSERPPNAVFRIRVDGRLFDIKFQTMGEAEAVASGHVAPGRTVEIIDDVSGETVKKLN
jgi:hypothetical protein